jgi:DNA mismatch repair protein MutH
MGRAEELSGLTLGVIAERFGRTPPPDLKRHKGWVGELIERALGATAGAKPAPDFEGLGVELKTLPVDATGRPYESTFAVEGERWKAPGDRRVGTPLLWSPSADELGALRFDWEELAGRIGRGELEDITAHVGHVLQIRPKARDSRARRNGLDADGAPTLALPRGFYLRATFTRAILARHFG